MLGRLGRLRPRPSRLGPADAGQAIGGAAELAWSRRRPTRGHFSIAHKTGRYEDDGSWTEQRSRNADLLVFAWHPRTDPATDHREPDQWRFFVVPETALPPTQSLSLATLRTLGPDVSHAQLREAVATAAATLASPRT